jgi:hypothetical protein
LDDTGFFLTFRRADGNSPVVMTTSESCRERLVQAARGQAAFLDFATWLAIASISTGDRQS